MSYNPVRSPNDQLIYDAIRNVKLGRPIPPEYVEICFEDTNKALHLALAQNARWKEAEPKIIDEAINPSSIRDWNFDKIFVSYANQLVGGRWIEFEDAFKAALEKNERGMSIENTHLVREYCNATIRGRWYDIEKHIKSASALREYAFYVIHGRWLEREKDILGDLKGCFDYLHYCVGERWKEMEERILQTDDPHDKQEAIINYCSRFGRWPEAEDHLTDARFIVRYAVNVLRSRWKEKESLIAKDPDSSFLYACEVVKGPFMEAESTILNSDLYFDYFIFAIKASRDLSEQLSSQFPPDMTVGEVLKIIDSGRNSAFEEKLLSSTHNQSKAVWYATNVLKSRWPEMEQKLKKSAKCAVLYARDVIKGRWEDAEKYISKQDKYLSQYAIEVIKGRLPDTLHNKMIASAMIDPKSKYVKSYLEMLEAQK